LEKIDQEEALLKKLNLGLGSGFHYPVDGDMGPFRAFFFLLESLDKFFAWHILDQVRGKLLCIHWQVWQRA
jgi:hypothetical protein